MVNGKLTYNNGQIDYKVIGSGQPLVFIHGFSLDQTMWQPQVEFFSKDYRVITYDARGFGKSNLPSGLYDHTADLESLLKHLKIEKAHIVGLSMGGRIATNFTLAYPEMVSSLTLMDAALGGYKNEVDWNVHAKEQGLNIAKENWLNHELFTATQENPEAIKALRTIIKNYSGWHWLHDDPQVPSKISAREHLHKIAKPTLILMGEGDLPYFHKISDVLAVSIDGSRKIIVQNAGHMVNMEAPDKVNNLLANFLFKFH